MSDLQSLSLVGGALCLDFANTLEFRRTPREEEGLTSFEDLRRWGVRVGAIARRTAELLRRSAAENTPAARHVLADARSLREAIYDVMSAVARQHTDARGAGDAEHRAQTAARRLVPPDRC